MPVWADVVAGTARALLCALGVVAATLATGAAAAAQTQAEIIDRSALRVCADPANMPFSNQAREGFENRIADLIAAELDVPVLYTWYPMATGFLRNTLRARKCDVVIGYAQGAELVQSTNAYYRTAYALVVPADGPLSGVTRLDDPALKSARIGVVAGTPPASLMATRGLMKAARPYRLMHDGRYEDPADEMFADLESGAIDAGLLWGPLAGWRAKRAATALTVTPLVHESARPRMIYRISMAVRPGDDEWKRELNRLIAKLQSRIDAIMLEYGVPLLDEQDRPLTE